MELQKRLKNLDKNKSNHHAGFSLVEIVLASAIFGLLVTTLVGSFLYGQEATVIAGSRSRAVMLAEGGIEAVKNIRDEGFANLVDGTYGLVILNNVWTLSGSSDISDIFTREIIISTIDPTHKNVISNVTWKQNEQRDGMVFIEANLTNWQESTGSAFCDNQSDHLNFDVLGASLGAGNKELQNILTENTNITCDILVDTITVTWTNALRNIQRVKINNTSVWTGLDISGTELNIVDTTLTSADGLIESTYRFGGSMSGDTFSITFKMGDGTTKSVSGITP